MPLRCVYGINGSGTAMIAVVSHSRLNMQIDPKQIARKRFIAFFCSDRYTKEVDRIRTTRKKGSYIRLERKPALSACISVGFNCFTPFYTRNVFILINI